MKASKAKTATVVKKSLREKSEDITYVGIGYAIKFLDGLKEVSIGAYNGTSRAIKDYQSNDNDL